MGGYLKSDVRAFFAIARTIDVTCFTTHEPRNVHANLRPILRPKLTYMNYYEVLNVKVSSNAFEIKRSYRKLAMKYHPNKNGGRANYEERFKAIANAYETLSDPEKKRIYDLSVYEKEPKYKAAATERKTTTNSECTRTETSKQSTIPTVWLFVIVSVILYIIFISNSGDQTTTGNPNADIELNKTENARTPKTGEIDFTK